MRNRSTIQFALVTLAMTVVIGCGGSDVPDDGLVEDLGSLMPGEPVVPEAAETAPDNVTVLFADDLVHVSRIILRSGESIPELEAGHRLYFQPLGTTELAVEDGAVDTLIQLGGGKVHYAEPGAVTITNVGELPVELVEVARTDVSLPEFLDSQSTRTKSGRATILENDRVRVQELTLEPDEGVDLPSTPIRIVYPLRESTLEYQTADDEVVTIPGGPSKPYSRPGDDASVVNPGDEAVDLVIIDWLM